MKVLISGASGFVGSELSNVLRAAGHQVTALVRQENEVDGEAIFWDPAKEVIDLDAIEGFDAVVHLAGESIAGGRWTKAKKKKILESRVFGTETLASALVRLRKPPQVFVSASAVGYYGDQGSTFCNENSPPGTGYLADVCQQWEAAAIQAETKGIRTVRLRSGIVLSPRGGILKQILPVFKLGLGGRLGSGHQYMSWISIDDLIAIILTVIDNPLVKGAVNAVSPYPVTNLEFTKTLGKVLRRPTPFPVPAFLIKLIFGKEMAEDFFLSSTRVEPLAITMAGHMFLYSGLEKALRHVLGK